MWMRSCLKRQQKYDRNKRDMVLLKKIKTPLYKGCHVEKEVPKYGLQKKNIKKGKLLPKKLRDIRMGGSHKHTEA